MSAELPWFKFVAADWLCDPLVSKMSPSLEGHYCRLLMYCWHAGGIPRDAAACRELLKDPQPSDREMESLLSHFKIDVGNGKVMHQRLKDQLDGALIKKQTESERQRKRAFKRWHAGGMLDNAGGMLDNAGGMPDNAGGMPDDAATCLDKIRRDEIDKRRNTPFTPQGDFDAELFWLEYYRSHPGVKTRAGSCKAAYLEFLTTGNPEETANRLAEKQTKWLDYWNAARTIPLSLYNFLSQGDCLADPPPPPEDPKDPMRGVI